MLGCPLSWFSRKCLLFVGYQGVNKPTCFLVKLSISVPALTWALIRTEIIWRYLVPHLRLGTWGREGCGSPAFHPQLSLTWAVAGALCSSAASGVCWRLCWSCVPPELLCVLCQLPSAQLWCAWRSRVAEVSYQSSALIRICFFFDVLTLL